MFRLLQPHHREKEAVRTTPSTPAKPHQQEPHRPTCLTNNRTKPLAEGPKPNQRRITLTNRTTRNPTNLLPRKVLPLVIFATKRATTNNIPAGLATRMWCVTVVPSPRKKHSKRSSKQVPPLLFFLYYFLRCSLARLALLSIGLPRPPGSLTPPTPPTPCVLCPCCPFLRLFFPFFLLSPFPPPSQETQKH